MRLGHTNPEMLSEWLLEGNATLLFWHSIPLISCQMLCVRVRSTEDLSKKKMLYWYNKHSRHQKALKKLLWRKHRSCYF